MRDVMYWIRKELPDPQHVTSASYGALRVALRVDFRCDLYGGGMAP